MITLRPYQQKLVDDTRAALARASSRVQGRKPRIMVQLPTGGGKTIVAAFIADSHIKRGGRAMFLCHRDFLLDQTSKSFSTLPIQHTYVAPSRFYSPASRCWVGMVQTTGNRLDRIHRPTLVIWDEAHHILASTWTRILDAMPDAVHIMLSATPVRTNGQGFDGVVDDLVCGPTVAELMTLGALSGYTYYAPDTPDLARYHTRHGDYKHDEIDADMGKSRIVGSLVGHYHKLAPGKKAIYFCTSVKNSQDTAQAFCDAGYRFIHLDGKSSSHERAQSARRLATGDLDGMTNVDLFGEGFDLAAQAGMDVTIEVVGLARPTKSRAMSTQQRGRVLRPKDYPGIILDHAGHLQNFGLPDDDVTWTLTGAKVERVSRLFECDDCGAKLRDHHAICPQCGGMTKQDRTSAGGGGRDVEFVEGDLKEIKRQAQEAKQAQKYARLREQDSAKTLDELIKLGRRRGYNEPEAWARQIYNARKVKARAREIANV